MPWLAGQRKRAKRGAVDYSTHPRGTSSDLPYLRPRQYGRVRPGRFLSRFRCRFLCRPFLRARRYNPDKVLRQSPPEPTNPKRTCFKVRARADQRWPSEREDSDDVDLVRHRTRGRPGEPIAAPPVLLALQHEEAPPLATRAIREHAGSQRTGEIKRQAGRGDRRLAAANRPSPGQLG